MIFSSILSFSIQESYSQYLDEETANSRMAWFNASKSTLQEHLETNLHQNSTISKDSIKTRISGGLEDILPPRYFVRILYDILKNEEVVHMDSINKVEFGPFAKTPDNAKIVKIFEMEYKPPRKIIPNFLIDENPYVYGNIQHIMCRQGYEFVLKNSDNSPTCFKIDSVQKLEERGWGSLYTGIEKYGIFKEVLHFCKPSHENIIESKFDSGMLDKINALLNANITRSYSILLIVGDQNKPTVEKLLTECYGATNISSGKNLSFVTADVPLSVIPRLSMHNEIAQVGEGELYELPAVLKEKEGMTWVQMDPIQCLYNPWEKGLTHEEVYEKFGPDGENEPQFIAEYYKNQGITFHEIQLAETHQMVCLACSCERGDTLYVLVDDEDLGNILELNFILSQPGLQENIPDSTEFNSSKLEFNIEDTFGPLGGVHVHAGILVRIFGDDFDYSQEPYQIKAPWIHFEAENGNTIHRHASDVPLGYLFDSIKLGLDDDCFTFLDGRNFCTSDEYSLKFYINRNQVHDITKYVIQEGDKILISYGNEKGQEIVKQLDDLENLELNP